MKRGLSSTGLLVLGAVLAVGCGGATQEDGTEAPPSGAAEETAPSVAISPGEPGAEPEEANPDGTETGGPQGISACCHVKCSNGTWYGPFPNVKYNNCAAYGKYFCPSRHVSYSANTWKGC